MLLFESKATSTKAKGLGSIYSTPTPLELHSNSTPLHSTQLNPPPRVAQGAELDALGRKVLGGGGGGFVLDGHFASLQADLLQEFELPLAVPGRVLPAAVVDGVPDHGAAHRGELGPDLVGPPRHQHDLGLVPLDLAAAVDNGLGAQNPELAHVPPLGVLVVHHRPRLGLGGPHPHPGVMREDPFLVQGSPRHLPSREHLVVLPHGPVPPGQEPVEVGRELLGPGEDEDPARGLVQPVGDPEVLQAENPAGHVQAVLLRVVDGGGDPHAVRLVDDHVVLAVQSLHHPLAPVRAKGRGEPPRLQVDPDVRPVPRHLPVRGLGPPARVPRVGRVLDAPLPHELVPQGNGVTDCRRDRAPVHRPERDEPLRELQRHPAAGEEGRDRRGQTRGSSTSTTTRDDDVLHPRSEGRDKIRGWRVQHVQPVRLVVVVL
mmetsp:Transcript_11681/g.32353  ORF Transcript_11681/g.32353 Transcript_11681/m.32353 type:complete len:430 (+) Transcript_11681:117-1406(+)